jgi:lysophospholipase L1-like esterase
MPLCSRFSLAALSLLLIASSVRADDVLFDMETIRHKPGEVKQKDGTKVPIGTAEPVEGKVGKAVKFTFTEKSSGFFFGSVKADPSWNDAAGFSFWVKGDGSNSFGGIELIDKSDFGLRYGYCFPIDSKEWKKIVVPWHDLIPELKAPPVDAKSGYAPANFGSLWFGKFFYWRDFPTHSYTIDQVQLEQKIDVAPTPQTPPGLGRVRAKLQEHKPITIVTMGDSLTDANHWANRKTRWPVLLADAFKAKYGSDVKVVNPAIGGTTLSQNTVLISRWLKDAPNPDLVSIFFGGNDWETGVRGDRFKEYLRLAIDQVRRATGGSADILVMSVEPSFARWETYKELETAAREVAAEQHVGFADYAEEFRKVSQSPEAALKAEYWVWDKVHLGLKGHELTRDVVLKAIEQD